MSHWTEKSAVEGDMVSVGDSTKSRVPFLDMKWISLYTSYYAQIGDTYLHFQFWF